MIPLHLIEWAGTREDACGKTNFLLSLAVSNDQTFSARDVSQDTDRDRHLLLLLPPPPPPPRYSSGGRGRGAIVIVKPCQIVGRGPEFQPVALSERERERGRPRVILLSFFSPYLHMVDISRLTARANSEALFETIKAEVFCRRRREERDLHRRRSFSCFSLALCRPPLAFRVVSRSLELRRTASPRRHFSPNRIVLAE